MFGKLGAVFGRLGAVANGGWFLPTADGVDATLYADFVASHYFYSTHKYFSHTTWLSVLSGSFTRASTAYYYNSSGVLTSAAINALRFDHDPVTMAPKGILLEGARTIIPLYNRDFTNGAWTPTNITPLKNQTGADGTANAASSLTATASDGTILQTVTTASVQRAQAAYVKRLIGTGTVEMTMDGGSTWTDITSAINGTTYTRVPTGGGLVQTLANPNMGFRIRTSGDSIAVDFFTNEAGAFVSSPGATTSGTVTRAADSLTFPTSPWYNSDAGTLFVEYMLKDNQATTEAVLSVSDGSLNNELLLYAYGTTTPAFQNKVSNSAVWNITPSGSVSVGAVIRQAAAFAPNDGYNSVNGGTCTPASSGALPTVNMVTLGGRYNTPTWNAWIRKVGYWPFRVTDAELQRLTA